MDNSEEDEDFEVDFGEMPRAAPAGTAPITTCAWLTPYAEGTHNWRPLDVVNAVVDTLEAAGLQNQKQVRLSSSRAPASPDASRARLHAACTRRCWTTRARTQL